MLADPHYPDLLILKGIILLLTAKLPESLQETISVLRLDPDNARARILRLRVKTIARHKDDGNALFGDSNWQGAINEYAKALNVSSYRAIDSKFRILINDCRHWVSFNLRAGVALCVPPCYSTRPRRCRRQVDRFSPGRSFSNIFSTAKPVYRSLKRYRSLCNPMAVLFQSLADTRPDQFAN